MTPKFAEANFNNYKNDECFTCHVNDATAITTASNANFTFKLAVNGVDIPVTIPAGTSTFDSPTVNVTQGTTAQIDFYQRNVRGTGDTSMGYMVVTPAAITDNVNWLLSQGGVGTAPSGWNTTVFNAFQTDTGETSGWVNTNFDDDAKPTPQPYYNAWIQEYSSGGVGTKAEGDEGGTDFGIAIPAAASGPYVLAIRAIGHDDGGSRHSMRLNINLNVVASGGDTTAPAVVADLATGAVTTSTIALSWTAPGDDGAVGTATTYDVRYSTAGAINDGNWGSATPATGEPAPSIAGTTENFTVSGLSPSQQYWFAIQTADEVPNTALTSNSPTATTTAAADVTAPDIVADLATGAVTTSTIALSWTAPGDDGAVGTATTYDVRYSTAGAINDGNWGSATPATGEPAPSIAGTTENFTVSGLNSSQQYWFAIQTADEVPNTALTSNSPTATTSAAADVTAPNVVADLATGAVTISTIALSWTAPGDDGAVGTATTYDVRYSTAGVINDGNWASATLATGEPAPSIAGSTENFTVSGLNSSQQYWFAIQTADEVPNTALTSNSPTATTSIDCTANTPTFTIAEANQQITAGSGTAVYNLTINNTDVGGACANVDYTLNVVGDSDAANFTASATSAMPLSIAPGGNAAATLTVTAAASPANWASNITTLNVTATGHTAAANQTRTSWINLPVSGSMNYNTGENIHIEFQSNSRFSNNGTNALSITDSSGGSVGTFSLTEIQDGAGWVYFYNWSTATPDSYNLNIVDGASLNVGGSVVVGNATEQMTFFSDSNYTVPTDIFDGQAVGTIIYAEVSLSSPETGTASLTVNNWTGTSASPAVTPDQTGTVYRFNFPFDEVATGLASGDWGYVSWSGTDTGVSLQRAVQFVSGGCSSCTQADPTLDIITGNQAIVSEAGFVDYTIQVINNDTVSCGPTTFTLSVNDSDAGTIFAVPSVFPSLVGNQLTVGAASSTNTTMRVTSQTGQYSGSNDSDFSTDAANGHLAQNSFSDFAKRATTTLSVPDISAPSITISDPVGGYINAAAANPYTVTGTASDDRGTVTGVNIQIDGGGSLAVSTSNGYADWTYSWTLPADGVHTLDADASDGTNTGNATQRSVTVDRTLPTTSDNVVAGWVNLDQTVTLTPADVTSGVASTVYCVDGIDSCVPGTAYVAPFAVTQLAGQEFLQYVRYASTDNAGNVQTLVSTVAQIDKKSPVDGASLTLTPGDSQVGLSWSAATDSGSGLNPVVSYRIFRQTGATAPACGAGTEIGSGFTGTSHTDATAVNATEYSYRVCAYDTVGNAPSTGLTATATPVAACVRVDPSLSVTEANQNISSDGGFVDYSITVTNNDSGGCAAQSFAIQILNDTNPAGYAVSFPSGSVTASLATGAIDSSLVVRVTANAGTLNASNQSIDILTDGSGDVSHANSAAVNRTTTMNVACVAPAVSIDTADQTIITDGGSANYTITVDWTGGAVACGTRSFDLVQADTNSVEFNPSTFTADPLSVAGGASNSTTLSVNSKAGVIDLVTNSSYFYTALNNSAQGNVAQSTNSNNRLTTLDRPCVRNAPTFNIAANKNVAIDGVAVYDLTLINNDVDCVDSTFNFALGAETGNTTAYTLPSVLSAPSVTLAYGAVDTSTTLTVTANGTGIEGNSLTSNLTLIDATNHNGMDQAIAPVTTLKNVNPLLHNSDTLESTKWAGDGGWGVAGGKYGEFTCATCHQAGSTNIKRVRALLPNAPDISKGDFPGSGAAILLQTVEDGTADFGDDAGGRATSNRICEVCHSANKYHNYDTTNNTGGLTHNNQKDCIVCHKHSAGFKGGGSCETCHGYPPQPLNAATTPPRVDDGKPYQTVEGKGAHTEHVNHIAALAGVTLDPNLDGFGDANTTAVCGVCHDMGGANHDNGTRVINFNGVNTYQFGASAPVYNGVQGVDSATTPKTCSNISCHFQLTPVWE